ncbi:thiol reductant ABC exporter subunit CydD [Acetobacter oeni]|uniref:Thiol reductant ABC exporter subunit CydD n=1 Tax=Acetobacter oeni TaxID=304077 RepID=A0A511XGE6_9PROT|nr:thiol reductant ABC exporter subunit CydD [Acetobacter oeni]MBB3881811.1 ATP-binding cassette subfamily C protein CydD [Acetobacter oeni]NHO17387.1 thiol reductant ABC exporter subunit CydD [Acetobacter oeni]GBR02111.1 transport ATP-binding protein CydD [Acetobacter oeni LMG 21952]GEN62015.1 thiol reductant ABC exporter subunit CydD [Acetobacter oeni]
MNESKAAIRAWTRAQARLGLRMARPSIILSVMSCLLAAAQMWCIANILGPALTTLLPLSGAAGVDEPLWPFIGFIAAALLRVAVNITSELSAAAAGRAARRRLRSEVLSAIVGAGPAVLRQAHSGALASLAVDRIEALDGYFSRWAPASVLWIIAPACLLLSVLWAQPRAALILAICGAAVPVAQAVFGVGAAVASRNQFLAMTRLQARFLDRIRGIATIVLSGRADEEALHLSEAAEDLRVRTMKILRIAFLSSASIDCAMIVALIAIAIADGHHALIATSGADRQYLPHFVVDSLFALLIVPEFFAPFRGLALAYQDRALAQGAAAEILALPEPQPLTEGQPVRTVEAHGVTIVFEDVSFTWDASRGPALDHVSFTVPAGETTVLAGPSGSGKSTVMELLLGFIRPDSGRIIFNGADMQTIVPEALAKMTSWIGQRPVLFAGTLRENITFAKPDANVEELAAALRSSAVDRFLSELPDGLETIIGEGGFGLSGGQAQRIAIARAYLKNAPVLLLDEPTAYLDPVTEADVFESLKRLALKRTVILASHSTAVHMFTGRRVDLVHGRVAARQGAA